MCVGPAQNGDIRTPDRPRRAHLRVFDGVRGRVVQHASDLFGQDGHRVGHGIACNTPHLDRRRLAIAVDAMAFLDSNAARLEIQGLECRTEGPVREIDESRPCPVGLWEGFLSAHRFGDDRPGGLKDQIRVRAAKTENSLLRIADPERPFGDLRDLEKQGKLNGAGVLELVDENARQRLLQTFRHCGVIQELKRQVLLIDEVDQPMRLLVFRVQRERVGGGPVDPANVRFQVRAQFRMRGMHRRGVDEGFDDIGVPFCGIQLGQTRPPTPGEVASGLQNSDGFLDSLLDGGRRLGRIGAVLQGFPGFGRASRRRASSASPVSSDNGGNRARKPFQERSA